ncbi:protein of unknown function [Acidithiobacillus ferrivorans]|uniref:Uncharacterized protein n=1 Tax=Acidithiobacillus ferrivorans TaxID=160808 RepID=A0A060UPU8_9PROT|nr:hypothetical protein [Acidithiobacillus ferrivorans]CDQ10445.1 hypothetical protein AFERRI_400226 [Acidithiobacillus ferrivorans]SMH64472.1 protein of unknown function [Acidithiobacillus ferrivorans]
MAERPYFQGVIKPPLASTLVRRDVEMRFLALARDADRDQGLTYSQYLERISTLRLVAHDLGLNCADDIRVQVARGGSPTRAHTPDPV